MVRPNCHSFKVFPSYDIWNSPFQMDRKLVGVKNEWSDVFASSRWFIIATNRYSFPVQRIYSNHAEMHSNEFNRVPFLFDTFFVRFFELVDLMKFFRLPFAWLFFSMDFTFVCIFHLICIDWFDAEKSANFFFLSIQIKQFHLFCNRIDKRKLESKLIFWNCLIQCRLRCRFSLSLCFFYEFIDLLLSIDFPIVKQFFWFCSTFLVFFTLEKL